MNKYILMADIIDSRKSDAKDLIRSFKKVVDQINRQYQQKLLSPLTITLGDEFQGLVSSLGDSIHIIFDLEEMMIRENVDFKLRYVLHYGEIGTKINSKIAHGMLGLGLTEAREKLNNLKKTEYRFIIETGNQAQSNHINNAFIIYQSFVDDWNTKDYHIIKEFLMGKNYKEVAEVLNLDSSTAWRRERSLKINQYITAKEIIKSYL